MELNRKKFKKQLSKNESIMKIVQRIEALITQDEAVPADKSA